MYKHLIGTRLRELRIKSGLRQASLAKMAGISASYLNLIEHDKRSVAGKLLIDLAKALKVSVSDLTMGVTTQMVERLQQSARRDLRASAELDQLDQFVARFPGWSQLLDKQIEETERQAKILEGLSDRLAHDPVLAETLHIMLSNIATIRSTSELLVKSPDMPDAQQARFFQNIFLESERLSSKAKALLVQFDPEMALQQEQAELGAQASEHVHRPKDFELESDKLHDSFFKQIDELVDPEDVMASRKRHRFDPFLLADILKIDAPHALFRLGTMPVHEEVPLFGMLIVDNAGGVLYRKEIDSFRLPSRSGACPKWPVYRALSQPMQPLAMRMRTPNSETYQTYAVATPKEREFSQLPAITQSVMIFRRAQTEKTTSWEGPNVDVGFHCSVCPRNNCRDRRDAYALNDYA